MLIRGTQLEQFEASALDRFVKSTSQWLRTARPSRCHALDDGSLAAMVRHSAEEARSFAILEDRDVRRYINLKLTLGPEFPHGQAFPWAKPILEIESLPAALRLDLLWRKVDCG